MKTTMRQRAREIIREYAKKNDKIEEALDHKIRNCDKLIVMLRSPQWEKIYDEPICPFPEKDCPFGGPCCCCKYFFEGVAGFECGCIMLSGGTLTLNQAINGLRIFKSEMKKYLKEKQRCPGT
ncbi:MAG: hypothetical protein DRP66_10190 [Planctomycetota bacterium]|nr:MAG: hypothetical protein DRP66_10190 [Planctomycetota bacterium]